MFNTLRFRWAWKLKQFMARPARFYGGRGTVHSAGYLDVEMKDGKVFAVWFRCQMLPFHQREIDAQRASDVWKGQDRLPAIVGIEVVDAKGN